jgi:hypothetical protein
MIGLTDEDARNPRKFDHNLSKLLKRILQICPIIGSSARPRKS